MSSASAIIRLLGIPSAPLPTLLLAALLLGVAGCATQPVPPEPLPQQQIDTLSPHQQRLDALQSWKLKGRLAIIFNGDSWNATIHWQKHPENYDIQLYLPLGQGSLHLTGDKSGATLETSGGEKLSADNGENLFYQQFGFIFPITALHDWVIGRPAMEMESASGWLQQVDSSGRMLTLEQDNWHLRLLGYRKVSSEGASTNPESPAALSLPGKVFVEQNGNSVRLVVQQWQLDD